MGKVLLTLAGTCVEKSFWPTLYDDMWAVGKEKNLFLLRSFRDDVLAQNPMGKEYLCSIYRHSYEIAMILMQNPSLALQTKEVINHLIPDIQLLLDVGEVRLSEEQLCGIER